MKTIHFFLKYVLVLILVMSGAQTLQAQDAFYIYRNDGNFDGFFFDEIVRMGYSKTDLQGEEHDVYVVQEVETKDSLYRIPLAAIDSIGFQQPEIRMNPKFKNMDQLGITPYVTSVHSEGGVYHLGISKTIPAHLLPQIGDVVASWDNSIYGGMGFVAKIKKESEPYRWYKDENDQSYYWTAEEITELSDVFDQFITVEDIGVDEQGNEVCRRIAGCNPDGTIRRATTGEKSVNLINLSGTFTREWKVDGDSKIALSADVGVVLKLRVHYNIGWTRLFVKLSRDLTIKAKPSLSLAVSKGFEETLDDICKLPGIMFPAACPIFETNPMPSLFVRGEGSVSASLNFPAVDLGIGEDIIIDDRQLFPISYDLHMLPSEKDTEAGDVIDTGSLSVKFSGFVQAGIKFTANISTASWFSKILWGDIGLHLYCGPKAEGELEFSSTIDAGLLQKASIRLSLLSLDLEAKAMAAAMWGDTEEKTFFSKNWSFLCDTIRFFPVFEGAEIVSIENNIVTAKIRTKPYYIPAYSVLSIGVFEEYNYGGKFLRNFGSEVYSQKKQEYIFTFSLDELKDLKSRGGYILGPVVEWAGREPSAVLYSDGKDCRSQTFAIPAWLEIDKTKLEFGSADNLSQTIRVKTNIANFEYGIENTTSSSYSGRWWKTEYKAVDAEKGIYDVTFTISPNTNMFYNELSENEFHMESVFDIPSGEWVEKPVHTCPYILVPKQYGKWPERYDNKKFTFPLVVDTVLITFRQAGSDATLVDRKVKFSADDYLSETLAGIGTGRGTHSLTFYQFGDYSQEEKESFTIVRDGEDRVLVTCTTHENSSSTQKYQGETYTSTRTEDGTMTFVIQRSPDSQWDKIYQDIVEGTCHSTYTASSTLSTAWPSGNVTTTDFTFSGKHDEDKTLKSANTMCTLTYRDGHTKNTSHSLSSTSNAVISLSY